MSRKFVLILYLIFFLGSFHELWSRTLFVGKKAYPHRIQQAIHMANHGDTILVSRAHYFEKNLIIDKPITLIGLDFPILDGENKYEVLSVKASHVTISGFHILNSGASSLQDLAGIKIYDSSHVRIINNKIANSFFGIYVQYGSHCLIKNNTILAAGKDEQASGNGIHCWNSHHLHIADNVITGHRDGIYFEFVTHSVIKNNRSFRNLRYGLHFMFSNHDTYLKNIFSDNGAGVAVMFSNHVHMYYNVFRQNWGDASYGILLKEISDGQIRYNVFEKNTTGIYLEGVNRLHINQNKFVRNGWALKIQASCADNQIHLNHFIGNTFDVSTNGSLVLNNFDHNYWDKYEGYDLNVDRIGDIPYRPVSLFSVILERNATALIMFRSFIAALLDKTEKLIPSLTPDLLKDNAPLMRPNIL